MDQIEINRNVLFLSAPQVCVLIGISKQRLQQLLNEDDPPPREADKTYRTDKMGEWLKRRGAKSVLGNGKGRPVTRPKMEDEAPAPEFFNPQQELARKNAELADKTALENQVRRGELIERSEIQTKSVEMAMVIKTKLLRIPFAAAPLVTGLEDQWKVHSILEDQIRQALVELSESEI